MRLRRFCFYDLIRPRQHLLRAKQHCSRQRHARSPTAAPTLGTPAALGGNAGRLVPTRL
jgi:hypothetical protein